MGCLLFSYCLSVGILAKSLMKSSMRFVSGDSPPFFSKKVTKHQKHQSVLIAVLNRSDTVCFFEQSDKMLDILITDRLGD